MNPSEETHWKNQIRQERIRHNWRQSDLAERLGTNVLTIKRWEGGKNPPGAYFRVKLCALFGKSAEELGFLDGNQPLPTSAPETEQTSSAPQQDVLALWTVPYARNPHFTGRDALLDLLDQHLSPMGQMDATTSRRIALTQPLAMKGLGGIGKTQIAVEYAYRSQEQSRYMHTLWINAASEETMMASFVLLAELLPSFPQKQETDQRKLVAAIKRWFEQCQQPWLLIFDNADDLLLVQEYLPQRGKGSLLLTTRANAVSALALPIDVEQMGLIEGTDFLLHRTHRLNSTDEEHNEIINVVIALDGFPLALDQAGAYIEETGCSFGDYLHLYQDHRKALLARRGTQMTNYPNSVETTWSLSFKQVARSNPAAAELLQLCAFLTPDRIPEELIRDGTPYWPAALQEATMDLFAFNRMIEELLKFSLIKRLMENKMLSLHRLVQIVQIESMAPEEQLQWAERVIRAVNALFPTTPEETTTWSRCARYLDQTQACDLLTLHYHLPLLEAVRLLDRAGNYFVVRHGFYDLAEPLFQHALSVLEHHFDLHRPEAATCMHDLAYLYVQQSRFEPAESLYRRALATFEEQFGPQHAETARCLNDLATLYYQQSKYELAEHLCQRALAIREQTLGPEHLDTAASLHDVARLYTQQGKYALAEPLFARALALYEQQLGAQHLHTVRCLQSLAQFYFYQEQYDRAERFFERALVVFEELQHPYSARCLNDLALVYTRQDKYEQAEPLFARALALREQQLGSQHPDTANSLHDLAELYTRQRRYEQAESLYKRSLAIREQQLGPRHPDTANSFHFLANLSVQQEKYDQAKQFYERALSIFEEQLGREHPWTQTVRQDKTALLFRIAQDE